MLSCLQYQPKLERCIRRTLAYCYQYSLNAELRRTSTRACLRRLSGCYQSAVVSVSISLLASSRLYRLPRTSTSLQSATRRRSSYVIIRFLVSSGVGSYRVSELLLASLLPGVQLLQYLLRRTASARYLTRRALLRLLLPARPLTQQLQRQTATTSPRQRALLVLIPVKQT